MRRIALLTVIGLFASGGAALATRNCNVNQPCAYSYYYGFTSQKLHVTVTLLQGKKVDDIHYAVKFICKDGTSGVQTFDWPFSRHPIPIDKQGKFSGSATGTLSSATKFKGKLKGKHITGSFTLTFKQSNVRCNSGPVTYKTTRGPLKNW